MVTNVPRRAMVRSMTAPDVIGRDEDLRLQVGLLNALDLAGIGHLLRGMQADHLAALAEHVVLHGRRGGQEVQVELALQALLDHFHMQQAQKAHAEAEAERVGLLRLPNERRVVEGELLERLFERLVLVGVDGEQARDTPWALLRDNPAAARRRRPRPT